MFGAGFCCGADCTHVYFTGGCSLQAALYNTLHPCAYVYTLVPHRTCSALVHTDVLAASSCGRCSILCGGVLISCWDGVLVWIFFVSK